MPRNQGECPARASRGLDLRCAPLGPRAKERIANDLVFYLRL
jgi:hypothetical protein